MVPFSYFKILLGHILIAFQFFLIRNNIKRKKWYKVAKYVLQKPTQSYEKTKTLNIYLNKAVLVFNS